MQTSLSEHHLCIILNVLYVQTIHTVPSLDRYVCTSSILWCLIKLNLLHLAHFALSLCLWCLGSCNCSGKWAKLIMWMFMQEYSVHLALGPNNLHLSKSLLLQTRLVLGFRTRLVASEGLYVSTSCVASFELCPTNLLMVCKECFKSYKFMQHQPTKPEMQLKQLDKTFASHKELARSGISTNKTGHIKRCKMQAMGMGQTREW